MVKEAPFIKDVLSDIIQFIGSDPIVGQNIGFDLSFLNRVCEESATTFPENKIYDTLPLSRAFLYFHTEFNLRSLSEYFSLDTDGAHRASADTYNTGIVFRELVKEAASYPIMVIQSIVNTIAHIEIPNKYLFNDLLKISLAEKKINGLVESELSKPNSLNYFSFKSDNDEITNIEDIGSLFEDNGPFHTHWDGFESRITQTEMAKDTYKHFHDVDILLAEAGTGLGKSLAYLTAGILSRKKSKMPIVVSTYTKNLQEQLFNSDIPKLANCLDTELHAVIYKGRANYICKTRLERLVQNSKKILSENDCVDIIPILVWISSTGTGDISECNGFKPNKNIRLWDSIRSEVGYCTTGRCKIHNGCFLSSVRKNVLKSDIIIVNHFLLCSELLQDSSNLPERFNLVIDEGHNLVKAARDQLITRVNAFSLDEQINFFKKSNSTYKSEIKLIINKFPIFSSYLEEIMEKSKSIKQELTTFLESYYDNRNDILNRSSFSEVKIRYTHPHEEFYDTIPQSKDIINGLKEYLMTIENYYMELMSKKDHIDRNYINDTGILVNRLIGMVESFYKVLNQQDEQIVWSSLIKHQKRKKVSLNACPQNVDQFLSNNLFSQEIAILICSATLTVESEFNYIRESLGLNQLPQERIVEERIYYSPFHYSDQALLFHWNKNIDVRSQEFIKIISNQIDDLTKHIKKRMLVLCTSYQQIYDLERYLKPKFSQDNRKLYVQTSGINRNSLIKGYLNDLNSVLIGTASFWEGVDLPGKGVELLMIIKIPFESPVDPIIQAQIDIYKKNGRNAFMEYQVPEATVKLKQGFGRLIRSLEDSGICIITDPRIGRSQYGSVMLDSLPLDSTPYENSTYIVKEAERFFGISV